MRAILDICSVFVRVKGPNAAALPQFEIGAGLYRLWGRVRRWLPKALGVAAIMLPVGAPAYVGGINDARIANYHKAVAKFCSMPLRIGKHIVVVNPSPNIDKGAILENMSNVHQVEFLGWSPRLGLGSESRRQIFVNLPWVPHIIEGKIIREFVGSDLATDVHKRVSSGSCPAILQNRSEPPLHHHSAVIYSWCYNKAAQKDKGSLHLAVVNQLSIGGAEQFGCEDRDRDSGKSGDNDRENRRVLSKPLPSTRETAHEDSPVIGFSVIAGMVAIGLLLIWRGNAWANGQEILGLGHQRRRGASA